MSERTGMPGDDDGIDPSFLDGMMDALLRSMQDADLRVGFIHDVLLHEEYGRMGVALPLSLLDEDGAVTTTHVWITPEAVPTLRRVMKKLDSPEVLRHIPRFVGGVADSS